MAAQQAAPAAKKRLYKRGYKSYRVKYGAAGTEHQAYARRLSERGLFIDTNLVVFPVGTSLIMQLEINGAVYRVTGLVRNARKCPATLVRITKPGMGVEFTDISPELKYVLASAS